MGSAFLSISITFVLLLLLLVGRDRTFRIAATATRRWWRRAASPFRFSLMFFYFPESQYSYFFFLSLDEDEELLEDELEGLLLLLFFLSLSLRRSGQSFFLTIYTNIPVTLPTAQPALIIGLRTFRLFRLTSNFNLDSRFIDVFSVHLINRFLNSLFPIKHLNKSKCTMKA